MFFPREKGTFNPAQPQMTLTENAYIFRRGTLSLDVQSPGARSQSPLATVFWADPGGVPARAGVQPWVNVTVTRLKYSREPCDAILQFGWARLVRRAAHHDGGDID